MRKTVLIAILLVVVVTGSAVTLGLVSVLTGDQDDVTVVAKDSRREELSRGPSLAPRYIQTSFIRYSIHGTTEEMTVSQDSDCWKKAVVGKALPQECR